MQIISERAKQRTPARVTNHWFRYEAAPDGTRRFAVNVASEDTAAAEEFSEKALQPALLKRQPISLNFINRPVCTQSFLHSLLFEAVRIAWARRTPIYIEGVSPAVKSGLELLEAYALSG